MFLHPITLLYYSKLDVDDRIIGTAVTYFSCHWSLISYVNVTYSWILIILIVWWWWYR